MISLLFLSLNLVYNKENVIAFSENYENEANCGKAGGMVWIAILL